MAKKKEKTLLDKIKLSFSKGLIASIVLNVIFLIFGLIIYLNPRITSELAVVLLGIYFIIFGIFAIDEYLIKEEYPLFSLNILWGILAIILGIFTILNPFEITKIITFALGLFLIIIAINQTIDAIRLKKAKYDGWALMLTIAIILLIFGVFIMINPMASMYFVEAAGIFIILASILQICSAIMLYTKAKEILALFKK